jgi:dsRNA-specific ribonuclease
MYVYTIASTQDGVDYQRLEYLGDAVLKLTIATYVIQQANSQTSRDSDLTNLRSSLVSNANLLTCGTLQSLEPLPFRITN